jgi:hypothetical protein
MMNKHLVRCLLAIACTVGMDDVLLTSFAPHWAQNAALAEHAHVAPKGQVILTVSGILDHDGQPSTIMFDLPTLQALPQVQFETNTMWTDGVQKFQGFDLRLFLESLNVTSGTLIATAINDYRIEIPIAEIEQGGPMIAYLRNGQPMAVRDKGPLWLVYPYDQFAKYRTEVVFSRSIWQLNRLEISPPPPNG